MDFSLDHRCEVCGCRYGDHKGTANGYGPENCCPPTTSFGHPVGCQLPPQDETVDEYLEKYWGGKKTTFIGRR